MSRTITCVHCNATLNLPEGAEGRRLKCPKCGEKFQVGSERDARHGGPDSTLLLSKKPSAGDVDLPAMPTASGSLRETFDLPLMSEPDAPAVKTPPASAAADALALFQDAPQPRRKKVGAEARAEVRKCPSCQRIVPVGMSLCQNCGLDLDSGARIDLTDDLTPPPPPQPTMPLALSVFGGLCLAISLVLSVYAVMKWQAGVAGGIYFIPLALFGVWSAVQFLRGRTAKLLLVALTIGAAVDIAFMIAFPLYQANVENVEPAGDPIPYDDPEALDGKIKPLAERLDTTPIFQGLGILGLYAVGSIYLMSPQVRRHMKRP